MEDTNDIQFAGVQNISGADRKVLHGGKPHIFKKDEIKVLDAATVQFLLTRSHVESDGKLVRRKFLFKSVPLVEALKHVKEPQNKSIAEAKKAADERARLREELKAEVLAELRSAGGVKGTPVKPDAPAPTQTVPPKLG